MRRIRIENIGPINIADFQLKRLNVIIGPQSTGKSCVLKIASFCLWVEKQIELEQSDDEFKSGTRFYNLLKSFHKLEGYFNEKSLIHYSSDYLCFTYRHDSSAFSFHWRNSRWRYGRTKISYIPAERNLIATIPDWKQLTMGRNNIMSFMSEWDTARRYYLKGQDILHVGVRYKYNKASDRDEIYVKGSEKPLEMTNTSSGLQSLVPMLIHLRYITEGIYHDEEHGTFDQLRRNDRLPYTIYKKVCGNRPLPSDPEVGIKASRIVLRKIGNSTLLFDSRKEADECESIFNKFMHTQESMVFLEEPEENLYPPTQKNLIEWILENTSRTSFAIATHSPYILAAFVERKLDDFNLMFIQHAEDGQYNILTSTEETLQNLVDYGQDAFFSMDMLTGLMKAE